MTRKNNIIKYLLYLLPIILIIGFVISIPSLTNDETFTMNLIHHSYSQVINIDSFDVHPPLYYLLLKLFLQITTFWTNSIFVKLVLARIFSLISFGITFYILVKIFYLLNIDLNWKIQLVFYLVFPNILYYSLNIRMYQLATMFIALEIYGLLLFRYNKSINGIILAGVSLLLVLYTNYFASAFAGTLLILECIRYLVNKHTVKMIKLSIVGVVDLILFSIYTPILIHQVRYVASNSYSNMGHVNKSYSLFTQLLGAFTGKPVSSILSIFFCAFILIIEGSLYFYVINSNNNRYKNFLTELILSFIIGFIPFIILSLNSHPMIESRYGFPLFAIIYFFLIAIVTSHIDNYELSHHFIVLLCAILGIVMLYSFSTDKYTVSNDLVNYNVFRRVHTNHGRKIYINANYGAKGTNNAVCESVYLLNHHTKLQVKNMTVSRVLGKDNKFLMKKNYSNIMLKGATK